MGRPALQRLAQSSRVVAPAKIKEPAKLNLADGTTLKRALDEHVVKVLAKAGYLEDHLITDTKIGLGFLTCAIALLAQFYPKKYPANWGLLLGCVVAYVICTAALNLFTTLYEGDAFLITKPKKGAPEQAALRVTSKLPRYSTQYTLIIGSNDKKLASESIKHEKYIGEYFHEDGFLAEDVLQADVQELLRLHELKQKKTN
ncbi:hypothetical protein WJX72_002748 [[Myrmecia] bisecta]|uniref:Signal peptidase complex subunit 2 n=1 Tax=[Myrmecia] bisecta TaxID=41462 RepID=A0AAW1R621_9CHLO